VGENAVVVALQAKPMQVISVAATTATTATHLPRGTLQHQNLDRQATGEKSQNHRNRLTSDIMVQTKEPSPYASEDSPSADTPASSSAMGDHCVNSPPLGPFKHNDVGGVS
jgi:hypothetical protein